MVFHERQQSLFRLNSSAAFIWCCLQDGLSRSEIVAELIELFQLEENKAKADLERILGQWCRCGLLGGGSTPEENAINVSGHETGEQYRAAPIKDEHNFVEQCHYQIGQLKVAVRFDDVALAGMADYVFGHLRCPDGDVELYIDVMRDDDGYTLRCDGRLIATKLRKEEVAPCLHGQLLLAVYNRAKSFMAFHAGAVSDGKHYIVMPGKPGQGKTTLTAALVNGGLAYGTDELVYLERKGFEVRAVPMAMGLKPGSWSIIGPMFAAFENLPVFLRPDGKRVRYLLPPLELLPEQEQTYPVKVLVFPKYSPGDNTELLRISSATALCKLAEAGYDTDGGLDVGKVEDLISWIGGLTCFELRISNLKEAVTLVKKQLL